MAAKLCWPACWQHKHGRPLSMMLPGMPPLQVEANSSYGCCQKFTCNIPCPVPFDDDGINKTWGVAVVCFAAFFVTMVGQCLIQGNAMCHSSL